MKAPISWCSGFQFRLLRIRSSFWNLGCSSGFKVSVTDLWVYDFRDSVSDFALGSRLGDYLL